MKHIRLLPISSIKKILFRVRVSGESCWPSLVQGKLYWASGWGSIGAGDFLVFGNPNGSGQILVKKVLGVRVDGYDVGSVVLWGASSRNFGVINKQHILGKIIGWNSR